jgi:uncharacterized lipoprotein YbaY
VTGTLTYREPHTLSGDAFAVVALVRGSARATENSIVASEIDRDVSAVPVPFTLDLGGAEIDPSATYTIQATIVDGDNAWVTAHGVPVLTKGNPSKVDITLDYRPDVLKGAVSGEITGLGVQPSATAYAITVLVDPATGASLGIDVKTVDQGLPVAFSVPYSIGDIQPTADYVVTAEVGDSSATWRNAAGVPVITKGNPKTAVQVVVTEVSTPVVSAPPTPAPSAAPTETGRGGDGWLLPLILLIAIGGAVIAFLVARGRGNPDTPTPDGDPAGASADAALEPGIATSGTDAAGEPGDVAETGTVPEVTTTEPPAPDAAPTPEPPATPPDEARPA